MKIIVLHDRFSNEPVIIRVDAINMIRKVKDGAEVYSDVLVNNTSEAVKENIGIVMNKIRKTESNKESE